MPDASAFVDEVLNELDSWPGVHSEHRADDTVLVSYGALELGVLDRGRARAELPFAHPERERLIEAGEGEEAEPVQRGENISHALHGPSDIAAVLELFDRRYRDLRGEDDPYSSSDER